MFGMSKTVVTPPWAAAAVPVAKSSLCSHPGSLRWTCVSMKPGNTMQDRAEILLPARSPCLLIAAIFPPTTPICSSWTPPGMAALPSRTRSYSKRAYAITRSGMLSKPNKVSQ